MLHTWEEHFGADLAICRTGAVYHLSCTMAPETVGVLLSAPEETWHRDENGALPSLKRYVLTQLRKTEVSTEDMRGYRSAMPNYRLPNYVFDKGFEVTQGHQRNGVTGDVITAMKAFESGSSVAPKHLWPAIKLREQQVGATNPSHYLTAVVGTKLNHGLLFDAVARRRLASRRPTCRAFDVIDALRADGTACDLRVDTDRHVPDPRQLAAAGAEGVQRVAEGVQEADSPRKQAGTCCHGGSRTVA